jgi:hypothetical protein
MSEFDLTLPAESPVAGLDEDSESAPSALSESVILKLTIRLPILYCAQPSTTIIHFHFRIRNNVLFLSVPLGF